MKILGDNYRVIDTFDGDMTVPDCLVTTKNKLGRGHGEAKLYVASKEVMRSFYGPAGFITYCYEKTIAFDCSSGNVVAKL